MTKWAELRYKDLLGEFAAGKPTPGGGAGAALAGALGAALVAMVANLTVGRRRYVDVQDEMQDILERCNLLRDDFLVMAQRDSEAFDSVMGAYRLPKESSGEKRARSEAVEKSLRGATEVPLEVMRKALVLMRLGASVLEKGNSNAASDAAAAVMLGKAALTIGKYNVQINLAGVREQAFVEKISEEAEEMGSESENLERCMEQSFSRQLAQE